MTPPLAGSHALPQLIAAVEAEGRPVEFTGAQLREGWENVVVETADGWIYRFPRDDGIAFDREMAILRRLQGRLPAPIPNVEWTGSHTRFAAYRTLTGAWFDRTAYLAAPPEQRDRLAGSLAAFLAAMHTTLSAAEISELAIPGGDDGTDPLERITRDLDRIPARHRRAVQESMDGYAATWGSGAVSGPTVVLHNDFHTGNLVLSDPVGDLVGVWDFSCVQLGVPSFDFRYFADGPPDLLQRLADRYQLLTGNPVDVPAAILAVRIENICDALDTGEDFDHVAL